MRYNSIAKGISRLCNNKFPTSANRPLSAQTNLLRDIDYEYNEYQSLDKKEIEILLQKKEK